MPYRVFTNVVIYGLLAASPFFLFLPIDWFPSFYDVRYMGIGSLVEGLLIIFIPRLLRVPIDAPDSARKNHAVDLFQFLLAFLVFTNAIGDLGLYQLYKVGLEFDKILHFLDPLVSAMIGFVFLRDRFDLRPAQAFSYSFALVALSGVSWEMMEFSLDRVFHSRLFGVNGVNINYDTQLDLLYDTLGALIGATIMAAKSRKAHLVLVPR